MKQHLKSYNTTAKHIIKKSLKRVAVPAPLVALLALRVVDACEASVLCEVLAAVVDALDELVALTAVAFSVLAREEVAVHDRGDDRDDDVHEHDAVAEPVPRFVLAPVLCALSTNEEQQGDTKVRTTFELTAPLMFPKLMTIASVTLRL